LLKRFLVEKEITKVKKRMEEGFDTDETHGDLFVVTRKKNAKKIQKRFRQSVRDVMREVWNKQKDKQRMEIAER
jgi:predicted nucleotidyltransferase component of viral defense system